MRWTSLIGGIIFFAIALLGEAPLFTISWSNWLAVIALALVSQVTGQGLLTYSLKRFSAGVVAVSMLAIPLIAATLAAIAFAERLSWLNWLAFLVVLVGIYLAISARHSEEEAFLENQELS